MSDWDDGYAKGRADEREHQGALFLDASGVGNMLAASIQEAIRTDLRAEVQAMKDEAGHALLYAETHDEVTAASVGISVLDDVLALFDGGSDD